MRHKHILTSLLLTTLIVDIHGMEIIEENNVVNTEILQTKSPLENVVDLIPNDPYQIDRMPSKIIFFLDHILPLFTVEEWKKDIRKAFMPASNYLKISNKSSVNNGQENFSKKKSKNTIRDNKKIISNMRKNAPIPLILTDLLPVNPKIEKLDKLNMIDMFKLTYFCMSFVLTKIEGDEKIANSRIENLSLWRNSNKESPILYVSQIEHLAAHIFYNCMNYVPQYKNEPEIFCLHIQETLNTYSSLINYQIDLENQFGITQKEERIYKNDINFQINNISENNDSINTLSQRRKETQETISQLFLNKYSEFERQKNGLSKCRNILEDYSLVENFDGSNPNGLDLTMINNYIIKGKSILKSLDDDLKLNIKKENVIIKLIESKLNKTDEKSNESGNTGGSGSFQLTFDNKQEVKEIIQSNENKLKVELEKKEKKEAKKNNISLEQQIKTDEFLKKQELEKEREHDQEPIEHKTITKDPIFNKFETEFLQNIIFGSTSNWEHYSWNEIVDLLKNAGWTIENKNGSVHFTPRVELHNIIGSHTVAIHPDHTPTKNVEPYCVNFLKLAFKKSYGITEDLVEGNKNK